MVPEMPGTTLTVSEKHCQPSVGRQQDGKDLEDHQIHGIRKYKRTADAWESGAQQQCKQIFGRHIWNPFSIFDAEIVRVEVRFAVVVSLRPQAGSTRLD